jgi:hypothetical protein
MYLHRPRVPVQTVHPRLDDGVFDQPIAKRPEVGVGVAQWRARKEVWKRDASTVQERPNQGLRRRIGVDDVERVGIDYQSGDRRSVQ